MVRSLCKFDLALYRQIRAACSSVGAATLSLARPDLAYVSCKNMFLRAWDFMQNGCAGDVVATAAGL